MTISTVLRCIALFSVGALFGAESADGDPTASGIIVGCENFADLPATPDISCGSASYAVEAQFESLSEIPSLVSFSLPCHAVYFKAATGYRLPLPVPEGWPTRSREKPVELDPMEAHALESAVENILAPPWLLSIARPYLLPLSHPAKAKLDKLFQTSRATFSRQSLREAGFLFSQKADPTRHHIVVARHPEIPGFLIKLFPDVGHPRPMVHGFDEMLHRVIGATVIRNEIERMGFSDFIVPQKWLYALPPSPYPTTDTSTRKYFVLLVEDVNRLSHQENEECWATEMTHHLLDQIHHLVGTLKLWDMHYNNLVFTDSGHLAFIDTKHFGPYYAHRGDEMMMWSRPRILLSDEMAEYWDQLVDLSTASK